MEWLALSALLTTFAHRRMLLSYKSILNSSVKELGLTVKGIEAIQMKAVITTSDMVMVPL